MNIVLCGFQGSGKTTCGYTLAKMASLPFYDLDQMMVEYYGNGQTSVRELHVKMGDTQFRISEMELLFSLKKEQPGIIALGGGSLHIEAARTVARQLGRVIYLYLPCHLLEKRLETRLRKRGCPSYLNPEDPFGSFRWLYCHRHHLFASLAHATIDVTDLVPHQVALRVWSELRESHES